MIAPARRPASLRLLERLLAFNWTKVQSNHARLASLWHAGEPSLALMNSHDPNLLRQAQRRRYPRVETGVSPGEHAFAACSYYAWTVHPEDRSACGFPAAR